MEAKEPVNTVQLYRNLFIRLRNLVVRPVEEWQQIHRESSTFNDMLGNFALPMIGLVTLGTFVSHLINQQTFVFEVALKKALLIFTSLFGGLFIAWYIVSRTMKYFHFASSREVAGKLTLYSSAPLYVVSLIAALVPEFFFVQVLAFYSLYLSWVGVRALAGPAPEKKFVFSLVVSLSLLIVPFLIRIVLFNLITI
jgi:hypothetical protein